MAGGTSFASRSGSASTPSKPFLWRPTPDARAASVSDATATAAPTSCLDGSLGTIDLPILDHGGAVVRHKSPSRPETVGHSIVRTLPCAAVAILHGSAVSLHDARQAGRRGAAGTRERGDRQPRSQWQAGDF